MQEQEAQEQVETPLQEPVNQEKMLTQEQVNRIVQREKENATLKARREIEQEYQARAEQQSQTQQQQATRNESVSRETDTDAIYQEVTERLNKEMQQKQLEEQMQNVANNYLAKVDAARKQYDDFDAITAKFDASRFPQLVYLVSGMDNGGAVIYDLAKNPSKLASISILAREAPELAQQELLSLSQSIAVNKQAQEDAGKYETQAPLDRLSPSRIAGSDGSNSISDLRSQPWLRG